MQTRFLTSQNQMKSSAKETSYRKQKQILDILHFQKGILCPGNSVHFRIIGFLWNCHFQISPIFISRSLSHNLFYIGVKEDELLFQAWNISGTPFIRRKVSMDMSVAPSAPLPPWHLHQQTLGGTWSTLLNTIKHILCWRRSKLQHICFFLQEFLLHSGQSNQSN